MPNGFIKLLILILSEASISENFSGDYSMGETPVPISNTAVKPYCADGTARATSVEE